MPFAIEIASFGSAAAPVSCGAVMGCPAVGRRAPALRRRCSVRGGRSRLCAEHQRYAAHIRARLRAAFRRVARAPSGRRSAPGVATRLRWRAAFASLGALPLRPAGARRRPSLRRLPRPLPAGGAARCGGLAPPVPPPAPRLAAPAVLRSGCVPRRRCAAPSPWVGSLRSPSRRVVAGRSSAAGARVGCLSSLGGALCRAPAGGCAALAVAPPAPAQGRGCAAPCVALRAGAFWGLARARCGARVTGAAAPSNPASRRQLRRAAVRRGWPSRKRSGLTPPVLPLHEKNNPAHPLRGTTELNKTAIYFVQSPLHQIFRSPPGRGFRGCAK